MIAHFNIPPGALINMPVTKKTFAEKAPLSVGEKRLLREEIERLTMKGLLQTRTVGLPAYVNDEYDYSQIVFAEVSIKTQTKAMPVAAMVQKYFPAPMFLIIHCGDSYCVNWCVKRINRADKTKRIVGEQQITRFFAPENNDDVVVAWLSTLDITRIRGNSLKELFDVLASHLFMLAISDEAGRYIEGNVNDAEQYRAMLDKLAANRAEQKQVRGAIKAETQFNRTVRLNATLRELQNKELNLKKQLRERKTK